ncbi:MAG: hypothetical protein M9890_03185 [Thermomicrobiales bacterium]|nr:hypothetical protein [Thermomicrobiales bacterium]
MAQDTAAGDLTKGAAVGGLANIMRVGLPVLIAFIFRGGWIILLAFGTRPLRRFWRWFWS